jgi:hypothetical protein
MNYILYITYQYGSFNNIEEILLKKNNKTKHSLFTLLPLEDENSGVLLPSFSLSLSAAVCGIYISERI